MEKVLSATVLMEDAKSGYLETTFGGNHKEIQIGDIHVIVFSNSCPDLSVLSVTPWIKKINTKNWNIVWTIYLESLTPEAIKSSGKFSDFNLPKCWLDKLNEKYIHN